MFEGTFGIATVIALALLVALVYLVVRKNPYKNKQKVRG
jgi:hypothetical protein